MAAKRTRRSPTGDQGDPLATAGQASSGTHPIAPAQNVPPQGHIASEHATVQDGGVGRPAPSADGGVRKPAPSAEQAAPAQTAEKGTENAPQQSPRPTPQVEAGESPEAPDTREAEEAEEVDGEPRGRFPVVGIGASAGGLEAIVELLQNLPKSWEMALIFVQHLDPRYRSNLVQILSRSVQIPVAEAADGMSVEKGHLYIIQADRDLAVMHGKLQLMSRPEGLARHLPIDYFFRSLAEDQGK